MKVLIDSGSGYQDYTQYVADGSLVVEDSINVPSLVTFDLFATYDGFKLPARSSYVRVVSDVYDQFGAYTVPHTAMPWNAADPTFSYHVTAAGTTGVTVAVVAGSIVEITYLGGLVTIPANNNAPSDANGGPTVTNSGLFPWPSDRYGIPSNAGELAGAFADISGHVLAPFKVGNHKIVTVPPNAVTMSVGVNSYEDWVSGSGSWKIGIKTGSGYLKIGTDPKVLATGFITNQPEPEFLGGNPELPSQNFQQLSYNVKVTSDEWLLNCQSVPYIPAFVNQTDSQILAAIADALMPGFFTTDLMATGTIIPYYQYDPAQTWSDIAKTFADANRFYYKVLDRQIIYQPFGISPLSPSGLGISYDEDVQKGGHLYPLQLKSRILSVPPVNDCIVLGATEPQDNWDNYFVGDGFTSNFQLKHPVFQGTSSQLLTDDWTEASVAVGTWIVNDPQNTITLADTNGNAIGALNVVQLGSSQVYTPIQNATFIQAQNGLELGGGLNLQHGQVTFNATASGGGGLIGGIFAETTEFDPGHCLAAFKIQGQPSIGNFTGVSVTVTAGSKSVLITVNGTNTQLTPGNVAAGSGFATATWLNGQQLYIISIAQGATSYVLTCGMKNPGVVPSSYGPTVDSGTLAFSADAVITTASGAAGIYMYPLFNGSITGSPVVSQPNHQYVLQTWVGAEAPNRFTRPYTNLTQTETYGAQNLASSGAITWVVTDYNIGNYVIEQQFPLFGLFPASPPPVVTKFSATHTNLPPFAAYVLVSGLDLNISLNYTNISLPPQGYLTVQSLTGASGGQLPVLPANLSAAIHYQLGFGMINQTAQVSQQGEAYALSFYTDDIPGVGARIRFQSWAAGQSIARVRDTHAIASEGKIAGDSGVRSAIMTNLSPQPRTSAECEAAAAAAILDREYPQWQGSYVIETNPYDFETLFNPAQYEYPHSGMYLHINSPTRGIVAAPSGSIQSPSGSLITGQDLFVKSVRTEVLELRGETLRLSVEFGPDLYLEKQLPTFLEREQNLLVPTQSVAPPNPITIAEVLNASLATFDSAVVLSQVNAPSGNYIVVDLSSGKEANAATSNATILSIGATGCEVRYVDNGWGVANHGRVGIFTVDQFTLPRTIRDQTFYIRGINGAIFSRYSKSLRVVAPLVPTAPTLNSVSSTSIVFDLAGDVRDIYGLEVRVPTVAGTGVEFVVFDTLAKDTMSAFVRASIPTGVGGNAYAIYSPPTTTSLYPLQVGDIILVDSTTTSSFDGFRLVTAIGTVGGGASPAGGGPPTAHSGSFQSATNSNGTGSAGSIENTTSVTETWSGIAAALLPGSYTLNMSVKCSFGATAAQGGGHTGISYSIDGGLNFKGIYSYSGATNGTSSANLSVALPANQDLTKVVISAFVSCNSPFGYGAAGVASMNVFSIGVSTGQVTTPTSNYVAWYDYNFGIDAAGIVGKDGNFGNTDLVKRGASVVLTTGSVAAGTLVATLNTSSPHGLVVGDAVVISCAYTQSAAWQGTLGNLVSIAGPALQYTSASLTFTTPALSSGDLTSGGAFGSGGSVVFKNSVGGTIFSGSFTSGVWTLLTQANGSHSYGIVAKLSNGNLLFLQVNTGRSFWSGASTAIPQPQMTDGAVYCGNYNVVSTPSSTQITVQLVTSDGLLQAAGIPLTNLTGRLGKLPVIGGGAGQSANGGVILRRVITAPADLVVDLTQPDIASSLRVLEASVTNGRISGINGYFFNLTWDYSDGTPVPSFDVPSLSGVYIDSGTLQVIWSVAQGSPDGYRILVTDQATGFTRNQFTVNHPSNPQLVKSFQLTGVDAANAVNIQITPFDAAGDGIPVVIPWDGTGGDTGGGGTTAGGITSVVTDYPLSGALVSPTTEEIGIYDYVGDTGSGGLRGTVLAPPAGSAASGMFLSASGTWAIPPSTPAQPYDIGCTYSGLLPASGVILHLPMAGPVGGGTTTIQFVNNLVGSEAHVLVAPTSGFTCRIFKGGALLGNFTIAAGQKFGTFTFTASTFIGGGATPDVLIVLTPTTQDPTAADLGFIIRGTRTGTGA